MRHPTLFRVLVCAGAVSLQPLARADEGQWTPEQLAELDFAGLQARGLELPPEALWKPEGGGLLDAVVNLSGCSAAFISSQGLIATNHHCAQSAISGQSSVEHDYLHQGFYAAQPTDELEAKGRTAKLLRSITDVTDRVHSVVAEHDDPAKRARAVELELQRIVQECDAPDRGISCRVGKFYNGSVFRLFEELELLDLRLVYAPPESIGNFGGEVDNWMWPRHSGDFTLLRAYVAPDGSSAPYSKDNVPFEPKRWLELGTEGADPGDLVMVLGFPGNTERYLPAVEVERQLEQVLPMRAALLGELIAVLEREGNKDPAVALKVAAANRTLSNRYKNALGMMEGLRATDLLGRRKREEEALAKWAEGRSEAEVLPELRSIAKLRRASFERDFLLDNAKSAGNTLAIGIDLVRLARESRKPDLERDPAYAQRNLRKLWSGIESRLHDFDSGVERATLEVFFARSNALPEDLRLPTRTPAQIKQMVHTTRLVEAKLVKSMFDAPDPVALERSSDPMIVLARAMVDEIEALEASRRELEGRMLVLGPRYFEMLQGARKAGSERQLPVYPDANGTLRVSFATVRGYRPKDGLVATPQTSLAGQLAKHTGIEPFDLPQAVRDAAATAASTYWADPVLGDVPVCYLSDADTTGGNSGSAVVDGAGRLVGLNFDRVWENVAGDFGYHPERSRNVIVDVRYLLWTLDEVVDADRLFDELGLSDLRDAPVRVASSAARAVDRVLADPPRSNFGVPIGAPPSPAPDVVAAGCGCRQDGGGPFGWLAALLGLALVRRRSGG